MSFSIVSKVHLLLSFFLLHTDEVPNFGCGKRRINSANHLYELGKLNPAMFETLQIDVHIKRFFGPILCMTNVNRLSLQKKNKKNLSTMNSSKSNSLCRQSELFKIKYLIREI